VGVVLLCMLWSSVGRPQPSLAFTRYSCTSRLLYTNQPFFHSSRLPALPTPVQYDCTIIGQYTTPLPSYRVYTIHHTIMVITIPCKGQSLGCQVPVPVSRPSLCSRARWTTAWSASKVVMKSEEDASRCRLSSSISV